MVQWEKTRIVQLIKLYKERPILYDTTHMDYVNIPKKNEAWKEICKELNKTLPKVTVAMLKGKIRTLRTQFAAAQRQMQANAEGSQADGSKCRPTLWCYKQLAFLLGHLRGRDSTIMEAAESSTETVNEADIRIENVEFCGFESAKAESEDDLEEEMPEPFPRSSQNSSDEEESHSESSHSESPSIASSEELDEPAPQRRRAEKRPRSSAKKSIEKPKSVEKRFQKPPMDEADIYATGWAMTFRKLTAEQQMFAKVEIEAVLLRGQLGKLTYPDEPHPNVTRLMNLTPMSHLGSSPDHAPTQSVQIHQSDLPTNSFIYD